MGIANRFWKLMGSTQGRDTSRAQSAVEASHGFDDWASGLDDAEFADAAHGLPAAARALTVPAPLTAGESGAGSLAGGAAQNA